jgi:hypothetical protein
MEFAERFGQFRFSAKKLLEGLSEIPVQDRVQRAYDGLLQLAQDDNYCDFVSFAEKERGKLIHLLNRCLIEGETSLSISLETQGAEFRARKELTWLEPYSAFSF